MIVITGATGQLGRQITEGLLQQVPAAKIGVSVRDSEKAESFLQRGVRVVQGDFADPNGLSEAFEGAEQVLLISVNKFGDEAVRLHANAIDAAKRSGAKRILYTSHQGASSDSAFIPCVGHAATEALLQQSGLAYVSLRNGFYTESAVFQLAKLKETGTIALPQDGPVSWTARADLASAAVAALTQPALFDGISPPLTGAETLDFAAIAQLASSILEQPISRETITDEAYRTVLLQYGLPELMAEGLGSLYKASRAGEFAVVSPVLGQLLGHAPTSLDAVLRQFLLRNAPAVQ